MTSEDFGFYGTRYPAIFYRLGVGPGAGKLHTSTFNPRRGGHSDRHPVHGTPRP